MEAECKWEKSQDGYYVECIHGIYVTDETIDDWKYCPFCREEIRTVALCEKYFQALEKISKLTMYSARTESDEMRAIATEALKDN